MKPQSAKRSDTKANPARRIRFKVGQISFARRLLLSSLLLLVLMAALLAILFVARGSQLRSVSVEGMRESVPAVDSPEWLRYVELYAGARILPGNSAELLQDGDGTFPLMWRDIAAARSSLTVQMYYAEPGALADTVQQVLLQRARAGVRVLLLLDAFGARTLGNAWVEVLRGAGVEVAHLRPLKWYRLDRLSHRSHVRAVVIDGRVGYTGGFGFADYWLGAAEPGQWRETNVRFTGPAVAQLQAAFIAGWVEATGRLLTGDLFLPAASELTRGGDSTGVRAGLLHFAPSIGGGDAERFLALSIASARRTLYITSSYFVPDESLSILLQTAARRGVDVRILTAGKDTDVIAALWAGRATYAALLRAGVRIYEYRDTMMHAKTMVVDSYWSSVGSLNFDARSLAFNDEADLVVADARFGAEMDAQFLRDLGHADEITAVGFANRSSWNRLLESCAAFLARIL